MKNLKKNTLKAVVLMALICPAAFGDGDMGGGGFTADPPKIETPVPTPTPQEGDMGGGGRMSNQGTVIDSVFIFLNTAIDQIF